MINVMIRHNGEDAWSPIHGVTSVTLPEPMTLTQRNNGEHDFPEWFHQAMTDNKIISHGMGKFGQGPLFLETKDAKGKAVIICEGDLFAPDGDSSGFKIVQRKGERDGA